MIKIAFIGAGSTIFLKNIVSDVLNFNQFKQCEIALMDIDEKRLKESETVVNALAKAHHAKPNIRLHQDYKSALSGADFVVLMIQVAGYKPGTVIDFEIPKKYGLQQTIADTLGIGGIMRGLRTAPVLVEIARHMQTVCPDAVMLQYVNPMAINCWALNEMAAQTRVIGLCHSVQLTTKLLAYDLNENIDNIDFECAGINHIAFFTKFSKQENNGNRVDLYPRLHEFANSHNVPSDNLIRYEMMQRLGYFVTESSEHFAEYVPWFIKRDRPDLIKQFNIPLDEYPRRCEEQIQQWQQQVRSLDQLANQDITSSDEYAAQIIHAIVENKPTTIYGNVNNNGLITNLPQGCCVEVACRVDKLGIHPQAFGELPPQLAALMQTSINVQNLTVEAIKTRKKEYIYHAAMFDPHTAAELSIDEIHKLVDELIEAHGDWLPRFH